MVATKPTKANAYEDTTATWSGASGGSTTTATQPSGLVTTFTTTGQTTAFTPGSNLSQYSAASSEFTPAISATEPAAYLDSHFQAAGCPVNGTCPSLGTITLTFSQPVTNPVLHFAGVGGSAATLVGGTATSASALQTNFTLTGATLNGTAATATLGSVSAGATNLGVAGSTISDPSNSTSPFCNTAVSGNGIPTTATAGCGSVPIVGTVSSVTFALGGTTLALLGGGNMASGAGDAFQIAVTEDQHFSDAPASYNGSQAPAHIVGDLKLGATVSANNTTVANSTTSPLATTGVAVNSTAAGEDAITSFPTLSTANIGSTYSLTVPISGASQSGQVCGYIDFTEAGNFNAAADKACANFTAGQTSVGLSWTIPAGTTAGTTYARLRAAYGTTQAASPTGLASSGEVEDYELPIVANPLDCTGGTIYALQRGTAVTGTGTSGIYAINTNALGGAITPTLIATSPTTGSAAGAGFANGLAITKGGTAAYFVDQNVTTNGVNGTTVFAYNATTGVWTGFAGATLASGSSVVAGAIDPTTGIYYYADFPATSNAPSQLITIYGFNTNTNTPIAGVIGTTTLPEAYVAGTNANGDFAFDALGDLYIVSSMSTGAGIGVVKGPLPTTGSATSLTDITLQTSTVGATVAYNGVAFSNTGQMFVQTSTGTATTLFGQNPNTAVVASTSTFSAATGGAYNDLAACSLNPTLSLQKNIAGRVNAGDQFGLSITGGGVAKGNTATTTGATTGLQSVVAGPVVGVSGTTYTLAETASGTTSLASYATTYSCLNQADNNSVVASGSAQSFTLNFPSPPTGESGPNVVCTFTNTPQPTLKLTKALATNRLASTDQFTMQIHTGGATGPVVNSTANSSTTGSGSTVTAGSGTTGTFTAAAGTTYTLTEAAAGTTVLANYSPVITCTDANGVQTGLPTNAAFSGSLNITPVLGAAIACVLTNTAQPTLSLQKALGAARVNTSDQFTVQIRTGSATGTVVSSTTNATTTGTGSSVTAGTGTTGTFVGSAGTQYFLTEVAASGSLSNYTQTITCTDVNGVQTGLPTNAQFSGSLAITPVSGAVISCTLTNTATVGACSSSVYYIATGTPTQLNSAVYGAGNATFTAIGSTFADNYNPVGYDPVDHYLYGVDSVSNALLRINPTTGVVTTLGLTVPATVNAGAFDSQGNFWVAPGTGTTMYEINVATQTIVNTLTLPAAWATADPTDVTFLAGNDTFLWGASLAGGQILRLNVQTGAVSVFTASFLPNSGAGYGAAWEFGNGNLGLQADNTGTQYQIQIANPASATPTITLVSQANGLASSKNDGASCVGPPTDLSIVKSGPSTVAPNGSVSWALTVTNNGPAASSGYTVADTVPVGYTAVTATPGCIVGTATGAGTPISCSEAGLANGASFVVTVTAKAPASFTCLTNTATVTGNEADPTSSNNTSSLPTCVSPTLSLTKALSGARFATGDQFTVQIRTGSASGPVVNSTTNSTTTGSGATVTAGSGTTGTFAATAGTQYFLTEVAASGSISNYTQTITCTDANGLQTGLPTNAAFSGSLAITPVPGAAIACTLTNAAGTPNLVVTKSVTPSSTTAVVQGQVLTYKLTFDNSAGQASAPVNWTDVLSDVLDDAVVKTAPALATGSGLTVGAISNAAFSVTGTLAAGAIATVTYSVKVDAPDAGNGVLNNYAVPTGSTPAPKCVSTDPDCTTNPVTPLTGPTSSSPPPPAGPVQSPPPIPPTQPLAFTGIDVSLGDTLGVAGLFLLFGLVLMVVARRRSSGRPRHS